MDKVNEICELFEKQEEGKEGQPDGVFELLS
jgi:hypothetical protein